MEIILQAPTNRPDFWNGLTATYDPDGGIEGEGAYTILEPKSDKDWMLIRNQPNPKMLFPIPKHSMKNPKLRGYGWFVETIDGDKRTLTPNH
jgi:hypothetical protein